MTFCTDQRFNVPPVLQNEVTSQLKASFPPSPEAFKGGISLKSFISFDKIAPAKAIIVLFHTRLCFELPLKINYLFFILDPWYSLCTEIH